MIEISIIREEVMHHQSIILVLITVIIATGVYGIILQTAQGALRGVRSDDGSYVSYNGIPYAGNPKNHRFKRAPPASSWQGIREADVEGAGCLSAPEGSLTGDEDCLFVNIHVPVGSNRPTNMLLPVMVWVHGGGFLSGSASPRVYAPQLFMKRDIILVVVNYRLGPVGFLCLGHAKTPGNAGAKDVVLALRWVRDNIIAFSGDSAKVTVAGESSGAAIVEALVLSTVTEGLIHRAIVQSGSTLNTWAYNYDAAARAAALARTFTNSPELYDMADALIIAKSKDLILKSRNLGLTYFPFALCSEKELKKEEILLGVHPIDLLKNKNFKPLPLLMGYNNNEAYILTSMLVRTKVPMLAERDLALLLPEGLQFSSENEIQQAITRIRRVYFQERNFSMANLLEYYTDAHFASQIYKSVKLHSTVSNMPVYFYEFNYSGKLGVQPMAGIKKTGAAHSDELSYLFAPDDVEVDEDDMQMQDVMTTLWSNFVKYGNPTPQASPLLPAIWEPVKGKDMRFYSIGKELEMRSFRSDRRAQLWEEIYEKHYYRRAGAG